MSQNPLIFRSADHWEAYVVNFPSARFSSLMNSTWHFMTFWHAQTLSFLQLTRVHLTLYTQKSNKTTLNSLQKHSKSKLQKNSKKTNVCHPLTSKDKCVGKSLSFYSQIHFAKTGDLAGSHIWKKTSGFLLRTWGAKIPKSKAPVKRLGLDRRVRPKSRHSPLGRERQKRPWRSGWQLVTQRVFFHQTGGSSWEPTFWVPKKFYLGGNAQNGSKLNWNGTSSMLVEMGKKCLKNYQ